jgi:acetolactate synthase-1/2/3 large subunit
MDEFDHALRQSLTDTGITIIDVPVDYSRNTQLFAQLHDGVLD